VEAVPSWHILLVLVVVGPGVDLHQQVVVEQHAVQPSGVVPQDEMLPATIQSLMLNAPFVEMALLRVSAIITSTISMYMSLFAHIQK
jgi:hypothetical protein